MIGRTILHYEIVETLGRGGMGVVYKARDTHLDRFVAIKVLAPEKIADLERKRRFVQEAKAASALNHPNIVHIYDIAEADGIQFIAMEYVPGKTLDQVIGRKGLRLNETLNYAVQIADPLSKAHAAGIIHRDLKPSNIIVTTDGLVKVLDFGLAKLTERTSGEFAETATMRAEEKPHTAEGTIVGTVAYMSPEQAEGKPVDTRSDVFAFGSLLYEMVTGQRAFHGDSVLSTLSAILKEDPKPVSAVVADAPLDLEKIIARCMRKEPERRWQNMADLRVALGELKEDLESGRGISRLTARNVPHVRRTTRWASISGLAVLVLLVGTVGGLRLWRPKPAAQPPRTVPFTSYPGSESQPAFSPDGRQIAFVWDGEAGGNPHIYVKLIDSGTPLQLTTNAAPDCCPTWSPDGSRIAFVRKSAERGGIFVVSALGGPERKLAEAEAIGIDWSPDGKSLAISEQNLPGEPFSLFLLSVDIGERHRLTSAPSIAPFGDHYPAWSPDGRTLAFARSRNVAVSDIYLVPVAGGEPRRLTFDDRRIDGLAWTPDGSSVVFSSWRAERPGLWKVSANSRFGSVTPERLATVGGNIASLSVSRHGQRLAYTESVLDTNIWRMDVSALKGGDLRPTKLIASTRQELSPQYSPDGKRIAFASDRSGSPEIWVCDSEGRNAVQLTFFGGPLTGAPRWSPDGRHIAFDSRPDGNPDIYIIGSEGGPSLRLTTGLSIDVVPSWSKDGRWIYFASNRSGDFQVWKLRPEGGPAVQVTKKGGSIAQESKDGAFLYYAKNFWAPGLWQVPVGGGEEKPVIDGFPRDSTNVWAVADQGIYFIGPVNEHAGARPTVKYFIELFSFATGRITPFAALEKALDSEAPALAISSDGRWILYSQVDQSGSDIMLVDNFR